MSKSIKGTAVPLTANSKDGQLTHLSWGTELQTLCVLIEIGRATEVRRNISFLEVWDTSGSGRIGGEALNRNRGSVF